jgi:ABC-type amino acid transport substrate-binding protein
MRIYRWLLILFTLFTGLLHADTGKLKVGIFPRAPFAMKDAHGQWTGLAVDVWERASAEAGIPFQYVDVTEDQGIHMAERGDLDVVVGEIGLSAEREREIDFTQPFITMPVAAAIKPATMHPHWFSILAGMLNHGVISAVIVMLVTMLLFAVFLWLVERRLENGHFSGNFLRGLGSAIWFAAVTMTTVGYGDKTPQSAAGRIMVFFLMFLGIVIVSVFTGTVASSLTLATSQNGISQMSDLAQYRCGALDGSIAQDLLTAKGIPCRTFATTADGMSALMAGKIEAFVDGEADLRYEANQKYSGQVNVEPISTTHVSYAFATRSNFFARDPINIALIEITNRAEWEAEVERWIGQPTQ